MNQILVKNNNQKKLKKTYLIQFVITILFLFFSVFNLFYKKYLEEKYKYISKITKNNFLLSRLYHESTSNILSVKNNNVYIIGEINIPKINLSYPIFSLCSDELLKISVCRFNGPNPGESGNLCIVGHNYNNDMFFSNLFYLNIGDYIYLSNNKNSSVIYSIYNVYETSPNDLSFISNNSTR